MAFACAIGAAVTVGAVGCSASQDDSASTSALTNDSDGTGEHCQASLIWLQKDAYADYAGRKSIALPPHTTTRFVVECTSDGSSVEQVAVIDHPNHGTEPDAKDANGTPILDREAVQTVTGDRQSLLDLADAMRTCDCDQAGGTKFLSTDTTDPQLLEAVAEDFDQESGCTALVDALRAKESSAEAMAEVVAQCHPAPPATIASIFADAANKELAARNELPSDFHVCNNDATLQGQLVTAFKTTGKIVACDSSSSVCHGPIFAPKLPASDVGPDAGP